MKNWQLVFTVGILSGLLCQAGNGDHPPLIQACKKGDLNEVKRLLKEGVDINVRGRRGTTCLIEAVDERRSDVFEFVLPLADLNVIDDGGSTALSTAAGMGTPDVVSKLIAKGAKVDTCNGRSPCDSSLQEAAHAGDEDAFKIIFEKAPQLIDIPSVRWGDTPLMLSSQSERLEITEALLKAGAKTNIQSRKGETALMYAAENGADKIVRLLLKYGADKGIKDKDGLTAEKKARAMGRASTAELVRP